MKILLIAGHGAGDSGAEAFEKKEATLTREIVPMICDALCKYNVDVDIYDPSHSAYHDIIKLKQPYDFKMYNYVLEVHFNAFKVDRGDGVTKGTEIYVTPSEQTIAVEQSIVKKISTLGFTNRGVKRKKWAVITKAKAQGVSSALLEVCFIDDADDMKIYTMKKQQIAQAVADGIAEGYKLTKKGKSTMTQNNIPSDWAKEAWEKAKKAGITDGLRPHDTCTREELITMLYRIGLIK